MTRHFVILLLLSCIFFIGCDANSDFNKAETFTKKGDYDSAAIYINRYIAKHPNSVEALELKTYIEGQKGEYEQAKTTIRKIISIEPSAPAYNNYGNAFFKLRETDSALYYFKKAYRMDSTAEQVNFNLAIVYAKDFGNDSLALYHIDKELAINPESEDALAVRAETLLELKNYRAALATAQRLSELYPNNAHAYYIKGSVYIEGEFRNLAIEQLSIAIDKDSDNEQYYWKRGTAYDLLGEPFKALMDLNKAIELDSTFIAAYKARVYIYIDLGMIDEACKDLQTLNKLGVYSPTYAEMYCN